MIQLLVNRDANGKIVEFSGAGHASFGEHGRDIVCAAVSALLQTAVIGLQSRLGEAMVHVEISSGSLKCNLLGELSDRERECADVILETILSGLLQIRDQYPKYIRIIENATCQ